MTINAYRGAVRPYMTHAPDLPLNKLSDPSLPSEEQQESHFWRVESASAGWGFPGGRFDVQWPPSPQAVEAFKLRKVWP